MQLVHMILKLLLVHIVYSIVFASTHATSWASHLAETLFTSDYLLTKHGKHTFELLSRHPIPRNSSLMSQ